MDSAITRIFIFIAFLLTVIHALPTTSPNELDARGIIEKRGINGRASYYYQEGIYGACGAVHGDSDYIIALGTSHWNNGANPCGKTVKVYASGGPGKGRIVYLKVVDKCESCGSTNIDLAFGPMNYLAAGQAAYVGIVNVSWKFT